MPLPTIEYPVQTLNNTDGTIVVPAGLVNGLMIVCIGTHQGPISSVDYGGAGLTQLAFGSSAFDEDGSIWALQAPTAGSATLTISRSGGSWDGATIYILGNAKQTYTVTKVEINSASGSAGVATIVPPVGNCMLIGSCGGEGPASGSNSPTGLIGMTTLQGSSFENSFAAMLPNKTGQPRTFSFGFTSGQRYGMCVVAIEEATPAYQNFNQIRMKGGNGLSVTEFAR